MPVAPVNAGPVAPETPVGPVAPETPVGPVAPETPVGPVDPVLPCIALYCMFFAFYITVIGGMRLQLSIYRLPSSYFLNRH